jgi:hypothetical protein
VDTFVFEVNAGLFEVGVGVEHVFDSEWGALYLWPLGLMKGRVRGRLLGFGGSLSERAWRSAFVLFSCYWIWVRAVR